MTFFCIILIAISALLHASWNTIAKTKTPSGAFFLLSTCMIVILYIPVYFYYYKFIISMPYSIFIILCFSGIAQTVYYLGLAYAYQRSDISVAYPVIRALPVLFIPLITFLLNIGERISLYAFIGMILISLGCLFLPFQRIKDFNLRAFYTKAFLFVLMAGSGTTAYTIIDSRGIHYITNLSKNITNIELAIIYSGLLNFSILILLTFFIIFNKKELSNLKDLYAHNLKFPLISGVICNISYALILVAMNFANNVSYIGAFRQLSIPLGAFLGFIVLKEKFSHSKLLAIGLIIAGLIFVAVR